MPHHGLAVQEGPLGSPDSSRGGKHQGFSTAELHLSWQNLDHLTAKEALKSPVFILSQQGSAPSWEASA